MKRAGTDMMATNSLPRGRSIYGVCNTRIPLQACWNWRLWLTSITSGWRCVARLGAESYISAPRIAV
eukprot:8122702-Prorocentrum_lima.AAC.1